MQIIGFPMIGFTFYAVHSGSLLHFTLGVFGAALFFTGLIRDAE